LRNGKYVVTRYSVAEGGENVIGNGSEISEQESGNAEDGARWQDAVVAILKRLVGSLKDDDAG